MVFGARPSNLGPSRPCTGMAPLAAPYRRHQRRVRGGAGNYRSPGGWQARSSKARPHPPRIAGVAGAPGSPHAEGALSSGAACPVAREFGGRRRCSAVPGTVSQRHVKSRGESASGCSRGGRFPVRAGSGGREARLPGRLEGERVRADTVSQCQNDAGRCGTQECPVCRGAAGTPCGARRAHAAITYGIAVLRQKWGTVANLVVFPNELSELAF